MKRVKRDGQYISIRSPQNIAAMQMALGKVYGGVFDEFDIRFLLSGIRPKVRELYYDIKRKGTTEAQLIAANWGILLDICDTVAHPEYKEKGALRDLILKTEEWLCDHFSSINTLDELENEAEKLLSFNVPRGIPIIHGFQLVNLFFLALNEYLHTNLNFEFLIKNRYNDVLLCFYTVLHYTQVLVDFTKLEVSKGGAILMCGQRGKYSLYAAVEGTKILDRFRKDAADPRLGIFPIPLIAGVVTAQASTVEIDFYRPEVGIALRNSDGTMGLFSPTFEQIGLRGGS